jgi:single-strand DNA-binding protein
MSVNKAIILGFVGKEPESRLFSTGDGVTNFSIATTERYKDKSGEMKEQTEWHKIAAFGKLAEIATNIVHKGSQVYVEGKISTRKWTKDGIDRYVTEIRAETIRVLNKVESSKEAEAPVISTHASDMLNDDDMNQDIPF